VQGDRDIHQARCGGRGACLNIAQIVAEVGNHGLDKPANEDSMLGQHVQQTIDQEGVRLRSSIVEMCRDRLKKARCLGHITEIFSDPEDVQDRVP
jgi:hypothetical protein